jgi:hypothetical protein
MIASIPAIVFPATKERIEARGPRVGFRDSRVDVRSWGLTTTRIISHSAAIPEVLCFVTPYCEASAAA